MSQDPARVNVLVVDDEPAIRDSLQMILMPNFGVFTAECIDDAKVILQANPIDVILLDIEFPNNQSGLNSIEDFHAIDEFVQIIMVSGYKYQHYVFEAGRRGAFDFIGKPFEIDHIINTIKKAYEFKQHKLSQTKQKKSYNVVLFDRDPNFYVSAKIILKDEFHLFCCSNLALSKGILKKEKIDVLIFDYKEVAVEIDEFIAEVRQGNPDLRLVASTSSAREVWAIQQKGQISYILPKTALAIEMVNIISSAALGKPYPSALATEASRLA